MYVSLRSLTKSDTTGFSKLSTDEANELFQAFVEDEVYWKLFKYSPDPGDINGGGDPEQHPDKVEELYDEQLEILSHQVWRRFVLSWKYDPILLKVYREVKPTEADVAKIVKDFYETIKTEKKPKSNLDKVLGKESEKAIKYDYSFDQIVKSGIKNPVLAKGLLAIAQFSILEHPLYIQPKNALLKAEKYIHGMRKSKVEKRKDVDEADKKEAEKKYGDDVEYADETNKKYPLDKKHIHAAISYFGMPKNYEQYDEKSRKVIAKRILDAAKREDVDINEDNWKEKFDLGD